MKTINSFRSQLLALTLALMASVSTFAYDYHGDLLCYNILTDSTVAVTGQSEYKTMPRYEYLPENLVIPAEVTLQGKTYKVVSIDQWAFYACTMLKSVTIPSSVTFIGLSAFQYCENLVNVDIPTSVTIVEGSAFSYTKWYDNLPDGEVYINNTLYRYKGTAPENTQIVVKDGTTRIAGFTFWNQSNIVSIELPQTLTNIEHGAFEGCTQLSSILIPKNVAFIGCSAFAKCTGLMEVICLAPTPPIAGVSANPSPSDWMFAGVDVANVRLYVPVESIELYRNADQWKDFGQILPIESTTSYKSQWCDKWNVLELKYRYSSYTTKEDFETWRYYLAQDTIINNYTYTAVTRQTTKVPEGVYPFTIPEPEYVAAVRFTDDSKVYIHYDNTEYLLYDFNVQPGDELTVFAGINHYHSHKTNTCRIHEVERTPGLEYSTKISLMVIPDFTGDVRPTCAGETKWIEGVGDLCGFITGADCGLSDDQSALLCAYKEGNQEYSTELEEYAEYGCEYNSGENKEYILTLPGLQRTGCTKTIGENENGTVWGSRSYLMQEIETATIDGKQYLLFGIDNNYDKLYLKLWLREENNKILLYSTAQKKDLVLYDFTLNVGDSLPRLYVDYDLSSVVDYDNDEWGLSPLVVTEVSTITLLDGKEYKKWTFDNGMQYVEGIGSFGTCYAHNDFYQLIANAPLSSDVYSQYLVCVSKNNKLLYQMDPVKMDELGTECLCDYDRGPRKDNAKDGQIGGRPTPTQWNQLEVEFREMENGNTILQAETFSYTLEDISQQVNSKTYFQLARQSTKDTATTKSIVGALHFGKEEDNRVYFLRDGVEYVLYDFTAEPGDTIEIFAGINNYPQETTYTHVVVDKDTTEDGACRMFLEVVFPEETTTAENAEKVWLAGLGSVDGIVHNAAKRTNNAHAAPSRSASSSETESSVMLCAWREDSCLYTTNHPDYDTFGCVYNQEPTSVEDISTSQSSYQKIIREGQFLILHNGKTYSVMGIEL